MVPMKLLLVALCIAGVAFSAVPLEVTEYYEIYRLADLKLENEKLEPFPIEYYSLAPQPDFIEQPYNDTIPPDEGYPTYGDLEWTWSSYNGVLYARDTIINRNTTEDIVIRYHRTVPNITYKEQISDIKGLNFGRWRGWVWTLARAPTGEVFANVLVPAGRRIRMFLEIYVDY